MDIKLCRACGEEKPLSDFPPHKGRCRECYNAYMREYTSRPEVKARRREYFANNEEARDKRDAYTRRYRLEVKQKVLDFYGAACACCGESEETFLTLDHVDNDGAEHRRELNSRSARATSTDTTWRWLVKTGFEEHHRFQILCYNCNCGKRDNGGVCPHQAKV